MAKKVKRAAVRRTARLPIALRDTSDENAMRRMVARAAADPARQIDIMKILAPILPMLLSALPAIAAEWIVTLFARFGITLQLAEVRKALEEMVDNLKAELDRTA